MLNDALDADRHGVALETTGVSTDTEDLEALVRSGDPKSLQDALNLCRGEFLEGLDLDCEPFEDWLRIERARYRNLVADVRDRLDALHRKQAGRGERIRVRQGRPGLDQTSRAAAHGGRRTRVILTPMAVAAGSVETAELAFRFWYALKEKLANDRYLDLCQLPKISRFLGGDDVNLQRMGDYVLEMRGFGFREQTWIDCSLFQASASTSAWRTVRKLTPSGLRGECERTLDAVARLVRKGARARVLTPPAAASGACLEWESDPVALRLLLSYRREGIERAIARINKTIANDGPNAVHLSWLSYAKFQCGWYGPIEQRAQSVDTAACDAEAALSHDPYNVLARIVLGRSLVMMGMASEGRDELLAVLEQAPNSAQANFALGQALVYAGQFAVAVPLLRSAISLAPNHPNIWISEHVLAWALTEMGQDDEAKCLAAHAAGRSNSTYWANLTLLGACARGDDKQLLAAHVATLQKRAPGYDLARAEADLATYLNPHVSRSYLRRLEAAGLD